MCKKTRLFVAMGGAPVKVSLSRWYISRLMVSERVHRQAHGILLVKVCSVLDGTGFIPTSKLGVQRTGINYQ